MKREFNAIIKQDAGWWIGRIEEVPGINSQGQTRDELLENLGQIRFDAPKLLERVKQANEAAKKASGL